MKRSLITLLAVAVVFALVLPALAAKPDIQHFDYKFNIVGHPMNNKSDVLSNDSSNGAAIFVPLKNVANRDNMVCNFSGDAFPVDDTAVTVTNVAPIGAKIYFQLGPKFDIIDRDATDSNGATVQLPDSGTFAIYLRVLGKPSTCMNINAYAFDDGYYFYAGSVYLSRKVGQNNNNTDWISTQHMFDVHWCQVVSLNPTVCADTPQVISVFDDVFQSYFWNILNDGTRLVQARIVKLADATN